MNTNKLSIYAVGDTKCNRPHPESFFELALPTLKQADILFGELEDPLFEPQRVSGLKYAGFDVMSFANDHNRCQEEDPFFGTIDTLTRNEIHVVGVGKNIEEARKPAILQKKGVKVAFLAYCSSLPKGFEAGANKPGSAPMRASTSYEQVDWEPGTPPKIITIANKDDLAAMLDDIKK